MDMADFGCVCLQEAELKPCDPHSRSGCRHAPQQYKDSQAWHSKCLEITSGELRAKAIPHFEQG